MPTAPEPKLRALLAAHDVHPYGGMERAFFELIEQGRGEADFVVLSSTLRAELPPCVSWRHLPTGIPVVGTRVNGLSDLVGAEGGALSERTPRAFADALRRLSDDPVLRASLGSTGRAWVSVFTWSRYADSGTPALPPARRSKRPDRGPALMTPPAPLADQSRQQGLDRRAARSVKQVVVRQVLILCVTFAGSVALARLLTATEFGLFAIATFFVEVCGLLATTALPGALIQRRGTLTEKDLQVAFMLQQFIGDRRGCGHSGRCAVNRGPVPRRALGHGLGT